MAHVTITHRGEQRTVDGGDWSTVVEEMIARLGPWEPDSTVRTGAAPEPVRAPEQPRSTWAHQEHNTAGAARALAQEAALAQAGVTLDRTEQRYATGTALAESGVTTQRERAQAHAERLSLRDAAEALRATVLAEQRREIQVRSGDLAAGLSVNGAVRWRGYTLQEHALRCVLTHMGSPAMGYLAGLRDRITHADATATGATADRAQIADVLAYECTHNPDVRLVLRAREGLHDIFAAVTPSYGVADAPMALPAILRELPPDAHATWAYDPHSTGWEIRAYVHTPTPAEEQAVGEAFEGYSAVSSRDNGTAGVSAGGGVYILRCLNATTYVAESGRTRRVHRGTDVVRDIPAMVRSASPAFHALAAIWGPARQEVVPEPTHGGRLVPIEEAIPGWFRGMLTRRQGELVGVLAGRTEDHVRELARIYPTERRDPARVVRADLAQTYTRYLHTRPQDEQRVGERAVGAWLVGREPISYAAPASR